MTIWKTARSWLYLYQHYPGHRYKISSPISFTGYHNKLCWDAWHLLLPHGFSGQLRNLYQGLSQIANTYILIAQISLHTESMMLQLLTVLIFQNIPLFSAAPNLCTDFARPSSGYLSSQWRSQHGMATFSTDAQTMLRWILTTLCWNFHCMSGI